VEGRLAQDREYGSTWRKERRAAEGGAHFGLRLWPMRAGRAHRYLKTPLALRAGPSGAPLPDGTRAQPCAHADETVPDAIVCTVWCPRAGSTRQG